MGYWGQMFFEPNTYPIIVDCEWGGKEMEEIIRKSWNALILLGMLLTIVLARLSVS